jgi:serine/threonine protein kinase
MTEPSVTPNPATELPAPPKPEPETLDALRIEDLVSEGHLDLALDKLADFLQQMQLRRNDLYNLQNRWENLKREDRVGKVSQESKDLTTNQITDSVLQGLRDIKRAIPQYFKITDFPVLSRKITDQAEVMKIVTEEMLAGRYENFDLVSGGNSGLFFKATSNQTGNAVVLKVLKIMNVDDLPKVDIARILKLKHRNIIRVIDHNFERLPAYVILEYINGPKLNDAMRLFGGFQLDDALRITRYLADALDYIRKRKVRHANIRPSKIYIDDEGQPMISSLDILKTDQDELRSLGRFKEECRYLSPEALNESLDLDDLNAVERSDQFSLGLLLLEMLTAAPLFQGQTVQAIYNDRRDFFTNPSKRIAAALKSLALPEALTNVLKKMLAKESKNRYKDLLEALDALNKIRNRAPQRCLARTSYDYCHRHNHNLIEVFYRRFFAHHPEIVPDFKNAERQQMMLTRAVNVVLDIENKADAFREILKSPFHAGYTDSSFFKVFLETLRDSVCDQLPSEWPVAEAVKKWDEKIEKCLKITEEHLAGLKEQTGTKFLSADTTVG